MDVVTSQTRPGVKLRLVDDNPTARSAIDRLTAWARLLGVDTIEALADECGVTTRTIQRARHEGVIGEKLMAGAVLFLLRHRQQLAQHGIEPSLDALFVVVEKTAA